MEDQDGLTPRARAEREGQREALAVFDNYSNRLKESAGKPVPGCAVVPDIGWIVDSGSGYDIVCDDAITGKDRESICRKPAPTVVQTANGMVDVDKQMMLIVKEGSTSTKRMP